MQRQTRTLACLSPYFPKGISHSLDRDRREAVSFLRWLSVGGLDGREYWREKMKSMIMANCIVGVLLGFIVGCDNRTQEEKNYDEALTKYEAALKDVELADAGNSNLYHEAISKLQDVRGVGCDDKGKKLRQDAENLKIKLVVDGKVKYGDCEFYYSFNCLDQYKQLAKNGDADAARICAKFLWVQAAAEPKPTFVELGSFRVENKMGDAQLKEAYQILKSIPAEKFTDADSQFMEKINMRFKEAVNWQNSQLYAIVGEGIALYPLFIKESSSFDAEQLTNIQWKDQTSAWKRKWNGKKLSFKATVVNVFSKVSVAAFGSENDVLMKYKEEPVVLYLRTSDNIFFRCYSTNIAIQAPNLKVGQEICVIGRYDEPNSAMISRKGEGPVLCDAVIIDISLFESAEKNLPNIN